VDLYEQTAAGEPSFVVHVDGEVAANGKAIALRIVRAGLEPVEVCLRIEDARLMAGILLALNCEAWRLRGEPESDVAPSGAIPLPLSAINVGQDDNNQTYLMLEVGGAPLMFGLPARSLKEIGQTLVALSADGAARPS